MPEALGAFDEVLLVGYVCDTCNNGVLGQLDRMLVNTAPLGHLRVHHVPFTKSGKLPKADLPHATVSQPEPGHVHIAPKGGIEVISDEKDLGEGKVQFTVHLGKADPRQLARGLYKMALGVIAYQEGHASACSSKYDAAQAFIRRDQDFPHNFLMVMRSRPSDRLIRIGRLPGDGTVIAIDLFGLLFVLNLEEQPMLEVPHELEQVFASVPLYKERKRRSKYSGTSEERGD